MKMTIKMVVSNYFKYVGTISFNRDFSKTCANAFGKSHWQLYCRSFRANYKIELKMKKAKINHHT